MEPETISKNGASPKSLMSRRNFLKYASIIVVAVTIGYSFSTPEIPLLIYGWMNLYKSYGMSIENICKYTGLLETQIKELIKR